MKVSCLSFFPDKNIVPSDEMVATVLSATSSIWNELRTHVQDNYPSVTGEWKHYGKAAGWTYKLISKKRNLLFFVPMADSFRLRIVLGEKATACVEADSELSNTIKKALHDATPYTEGRSLDIDVDQYEQLETIKRLLRIKFEN